jgi:flagellar basal-body rod modification protein FlgD
MIFVAQLRNQNPMEPDSNGEFIAQLAQFDSLVSLNNINDTLSALQGSSLLGEASGLIGRVIVAEPDPGGDPVTGIVDGIELDGGEVLLQVDGQLVPVGTVRVVRDA